MKNILNDDLISRTAAIAQIKENYCDWCDHTDLCKSCETYDCIATIEQHVPAVDAAPVSHGHWIPDTWRGNDVMSGGSMATCSECGKGWLDTRRMRFCPCCGAKMDGGEKNGAVAKPENAG